MKPDLPLGHRALVIEDDSSVAKLIGRSLAPEVPVDWAVSPERGRAKLTEHSYDLLILDLYFGGEARGLNLLADLPGNRTEAPLLVLVVTAYEGPPGGGTIREADGWITKPFAPADLRRTVRQLLE